MIVVIIIDVITTIIVIVDESNIIMINVIDVMITMIDGIIMTGIINNSQNASQINPLAVGIEAVVVVDEVVDLNHERLIMPMPSRASI